LFVVIGFAFPAGFHLSVFGGWERVGKARSTKRANQNPVPAIIRSRGFPRNHSFRQQLCSTPQLPSAPQSKLFLYYLNQLIIIMNTQVTPSKAVSLLLCHLHHLHVDSNANTYLQ
jgi:hypothetical protein